MFEWLIGIAAQNLTLFGLAFLALLMLSLEVGYRAGVFIKRKGLVRKNSDRSAGFVVSGMLVLLAFFLGTALSIVATEFKERQAVVLAEANAIGSSWLIAGAQADNTGSGIQQLLQTYTRVRISAVKDAQTPEDKSRAVQRTGALQNEIWAIASDIAKQTPNNVSASLLTALTEAFDNSVAQRVAFDMPIPTHVMKLLTITAILTLMATGLNLGSLGNRMRVLTSLLLIVFTGAVVLIADLSRPYVGGIKVSPEPLIWTLGSIQPAP